MSKMTLADAVVDQLKRMNETVIIPKLDHTFCHAVIEYADRKPSKGFGDYRRTLECNRVARALDHDDRFEKFIHITGCRAYELIKSKNGSVEV